MKVTKCRESTAESLKIINSLLISVLRKQSVQYN